MAKRTDDAISTLALLAVGYLILREWYTVDVAAPLRQQGAKLYESLHPSERGHANDLPGHQMTKAALLELARSVGFPNPQLAVAIALAESGGVPNAIARSSRENSIGLWQINIKVHTKYTAEDMADPKKNALAALELSKQGNDWRPWTQYRNGAYKRFL